MFRLVRIDNDLKLIDEKNAARPSDPRLLNEISAPGNLPEAPAAPSKVEAKVWEDFVRTGRADASVVPKFILDSWNRCLEAELQFSGGRCPDILSSRELEKRKNLLVEAADPVMETLYQCVRGTDFVVVLIDADGYILKSIGDLKALRRAENLSFGPGSNWSEMSVGTNAIGTSLALGRPIKVTGPEHYNDGHHSWMCAASVIRDPNGKVIGCLDLSGPRSNEKFNSLGIVSASIRNIEERLRMEQAHYSLLRANRFMNNAINTVSEGVISVTSEGMINGVNRAAARLLGMVPSDMVGRDAGSVLNLNINKAQIDNFSAPGGKNLKISTRSGNVHCRASVKPFRNDEKGEEGAIVTLSSPGRAKESKPRFEGFKARYSFTDIIGKSEAIQEAVNRAVLAARSPSTVLVLGESGTGKEVFAQAVHNAGERRDAPFVSINCGAISRELVQSELFGYSDGAFTGARKGGRLGKLEIADGGTLFLDEIAEMPLEMQVNLLKVIEDKAILPVGGDKVVPADVRIIAATNKSLYHEVRNGNFREDLYYRLNVVSLEIPPLRERGEDIDLLTDYYLERLSVVMDKNIDRVDPRFMTAVRKYDWPGNVRELVNVLEQAVNFMQDDELRLEHLPARIKPERAAPAFLDQDDILPLAVLEKAAIEHALSKCRGNISRVAKALGIGRNTLYDKMKRHGIEVQRA